jgi:hypothetical protein
MASEDRAKATGEPRSPIQYGPLRMQVEDYDRLERALARSLSREGLSVTVEQDADPLGDWETLPGNVTTFDDDLSEDGPENIPEIVAAEVV